MEPSDIGIKKRRKQPERNHQDALIEWFRLAYPKELMIHVPNELVRGCAQARASWLSGLCPGFPDLVLFCAKGKYHGLVIELKRPYKRGESKAKPTERQLEIMAHLNDRGFLSVPVWGWDQAKRLIEKYMRLVDG